MIHIRRLSESRRPYSIQRTRRESHQSFQPRSQTYISRAFRAYPQHRRNLNHSASLIHFTNAIISQADFRHDVPDLLEYYYWMWSSMGSNHNAVFPRHGLRQLHNLPRWFNEYGAG